MNYKKTLNLPKTKFPMKANLANKEPNQLKEWDDRVKHYTGNTVDIEITYVTNYEQQPGWVVFGFNHDV